MSGGADNIKKWACPDGDFMKNFSGVFCAWCFVCAHACVCLCLCMCVRVRVRVYPAVCSLTSFVGSADWVIEAGYVTLALSMRLSSSSLSPPPPPPPSLLPSLIRRPLTASSRR